MWLRGSQFPCKVAIFINIFRIFKRKKKTIYNRYLEFNFSKLSMESDILSFFLKKKAWKFLNFSYIKVRNVENKKWPACSKAYSFCRRCFSASHPRRRPASRIAAVRVPSRRNSAATPAGAPSWSRWRTPKLVLTYVFFSKCFFRVYWNKKIIHLFRSTKIIVIIKGGCKFSR